MRIPCSLILAASLACVCGSAWAQTATLEARMGADRFQAAGLHKLDASELRELEGWIAGQAAEVRTAVENDRRGLREADARAEIDAAPVRSTLAGRFEGFARGRDYTLANGQVWKQVGETPLQGVRAESPAVEITRARLGGWWLRVAGYNTRVRVERVR